MFTIIVIQVEVTVLAEFGTNTRVLCLYSTWHRQPGQNEYRIFSTLFRHYIETGFLDSAHTTWHPSDSNSQEKWKTSPMVSSSPPERSSFRVLSFIDPSIFTRKSRDDDIAMEYAWCYFRYVWKHMGYAYHIKNLTKYRMRESDLHWVVHEKLQSDCKPLDICLYWHQRSPDIKWHSVRHTSRR